MTAGSIVTAILDDDGKVTYDPPPSVESSAQHYVDAAFEADATLLDSREAYLQRNGYEWPEHARETCFMVFTEKWQKAESAGMGEAERGEKRRVQSVDREAVNTFVAEIEKRNPEKARRAQLVRALTGKGYDRRDAVELAREAIPDPAGDDDGDDAQAPLVTSGAELLTGVTLDDTPMLAPGLAYEGRAVLMHAQRGRGKTTLLAWLASRATVDGRRVLVIGDDDSHSWKVRMVGFGADHGRWDYGRASRLAPAGMLEKAIESGAYEWILVDNWRTWGLSCGIPAAGGFGNTDAAAVPIQRLVDLTADGIALTVVANEGHHDQTRSRDSIVVEDAVHAVRKVLLDEDSRITTVQAGLKTRVGIDTITRRWKLREDEDGMDLIPDGPAAGGLVVDDPQSTMTRAVLDYLAEHPGGVSLRDAERAIAGRDASIRATVKRVAMKGTDGKWTAIEPAAGECGPTAVPLPRADPAAVRPDSAAHPRPTGPAAPAAVRPDSAAHPRPTGPAAPAAVRPDSAAHPIVPAARAAPLPLRPVRAAGAALVGPTPAPEKTPAQAAEPWHDWPDGVLTAERLSQRIALAEACGATLHAADPLMPAGAYALQIRRLLADPQARPGALVRLGPVYDPPACIGHWPLPAALAFLGLSVLPNERNN